MRLLPFHHHLLALLLSAAGCSSTRPAHPTRTPHAAHVSTVDPQTAPRTPFAHGSCVLTTPEGETRHDYRDGLLLRSESDTERLVYRYAGDRLIRIERLSPEDGEPIVAEHSYDVEGRLIVTRMPGGDVRYGYDPMGRLRSLETEGDPDVSGQLVVFEYWGDAGTLRRWSLFALDVEEADAPVMWWDFDSRGRPTLMHSPLGDMKIYHVDSTRLVARGEAYAAEAPPGSLGTMVIGVDSEARVMAIYSWHGHSMLQAFEYRYDGEFRGMACGDVLTAGAEHMSSPVTRW